MNPTRYIDQAVCIAAALLSHNISQADTYLVDNNDDLIGVVQTVQARYEDTLLDIARANGLGVTDIKLANPDVDTWLPGQGREIILPTRFLLPRTPRDGIVLNIPEMRLYYFPPADYDQPSPVITHPLGIGRQGWGTPYVTTEVVQKSQRPYWYPPESIRKEHEEMGDPLPEQVPPGSDNPLGDYAIRLGLTSYLIHGTNKPYGIGMRVSHGCIRLYPEDIEALYGMVELDTPVYIVNQPFKLGVQDGQIYLEAHPWLEEDAAEFQGDLTSVVKMLIAVSKERRYELDWSLARQVIDDANGLPVAVGRLLETVEQTSPAGDAGE
ncbi:MAG: L,D-transpeptidase family protein [Gammaproteobacteria bacterium]